MKDLIEQDRLAQLLIVGEFVTGPDEAWRRLDRAALVISITPGDPKPLGMDLQILPSKCWLLGLGNLGQAVLWVLGLLPYVDPAQVTLLLQDTDISEHGNLDIQVLTKPHWVGLKKARMAAEWAEARGFNTVIDERLFTSSTQRTPDEPGLAFVGVDNLVARRAAARDGAGFDLLIDAGLGATSTEIFDIRIHSFPGSRNPAAAWPEIPLTEEVPLNPILSHLVNEGIINHCGAVTIAGRTQANGRRLELWCQTTSYKGNSTGNPEPNKTYEVRETLVEALSLREHVDAPNKVDARTIHFTIGDKNYTYQWFLSLKAASFDCSVYVGQTGVDVFDILATTLIGAITETEKRKKLQAALDREDKLGIFINAALKDLLSWFIKDGMPKSNLAELQWQLVAEALKIPEIPFPNLTKIVGSDIKGRANRALFGETLDPDPPIIQTVTKMLDKNPFLANAIKVLSDWDQFKRDIALITDDSKSFSECIKNLWAASYPLSLITRRILLRISFLAGFAKHCQMLGQACPTYGLLFLRFGILNLRML